MKLQTITVLVCLFGASLSLPIYQQQIGILASNSNEILRLNGLTLTGVGFGQTQMQASPFMPQYVIQQQPELGLPQMVNFNPQVGGPFGPQMMFPTQGNQLPPMLYANAQQEQPGAPQDPNNPNNPQQPHNPAQGVPQFPQYYPSFSFPQQPRMQGYPYYMSYGYPNYPQPNQNYPQPNQNNGLNQQNLEKTPQKPQLPLQQAAQPQSPGKTWPKGFQTEAANPPPDHRGDTVDPGVDEGRPNFSFLFEP
ncbi:proline-rich proteoglycan 2 isoform X1 [Salmo salar]|uniref:Proline-rich proteoglycan 2 isoform X1 n=1 Tax=Salmo salar TaxID=8030 RepID=A0A1S3RFQ0_SALSA|nr:proline-rich proteoglycan 2 isoform X1 [Salmo salar]|eukprot:XP_014051125.1 PREDICTED: proline-rich proteoglycan 2-like isoform X1 [Salmo salar]